MLPVWFLARRHAYPGGLTFTPASCREPSTPDASIAIASPPCQDTRRRAASGPRHLPAGRPSDDSRRPANWAQPSISLTRRKAPAPRPPWVLPVLTSPSWCRQVSAGGRACAFSATPSGVVVLSGQGRRFGWLPRHCDWDSLPGELADHRREASGLRGGAGHGWRA